MPPRRGEPLACDDEALETARPHLRTDHPGCRMDGALSLRRRRWHAAARRGVAATCRTRGADAQSRRSGATPPEPAYRYHPDWQRVREMRKAWGSK
jgi:hypothetical protein